MSRPIDADALMERLQNIAYDDWNQGITISFADACHEIIDIIEEQPTIEPQPEISLDESCTDCPLYDKDRHRCPRFNKVIQETLRELQSAQPEIIRCKDCKHRYVDGVNVRFNVCELNHNRVQADDWYCADAERREE